MDRQCRDPRRGGQRRFPEDCPTRNGATRDADLLAVTAALGGVMDLHDRGTSLTKLPEDDVGLPESRTRKDPLL